MPSTELCPCGSESSLKDCCLPLIEGKREAATTEQLLRARYTAFTRGDVDFVLSTHHTRTRAEVKREEIEEWSKQSEWLGLKIVQQEAGTAKDNEGKIVFCARYQTKNADGTVQGHDHWEQSLFEKEDGHWRFVDAHGIKQGPVRRAEPKVGRNDPCTCGSGKKYKKCCA